MDFHKSNVDKIFSSMKIVNYGTWQVINVMFSFLICLFSVYLGGTSKYSHCTFLTMDHKGVYVMNLRNVCFAIQMNLLLLLTFPCICCSHSMISDCRCGAVDKAAMKPTGYETLPKKSMKFSSTKFSFFKSPTWAWQSADW